MKINRFHLGEAILLEIEKKGIPKKQFAEMLGIQRQNINKTVFQRASLDTDLLLRICEVLDIDFFSRFITECNTTADARCQEVKEVKATLTVELGARKGEKVLLFELGENGIQIIDKPKK